MNTNKQHKKKQTRKEKQKRERKKKERKKRTEEYCHIVVHVKNSQMIHNKLF